ncbi:peptide chain release factor N(5)-glutamine methyltransferase [Pelagibacterales bacterium SAG-MED28]|nr:peptide chain release factor N(5)-glutamine methyltransferase [Pelagibacterales bacterium SAG-MED28]|tara:strand:+ start:217 stop:1056 length:840 start_codon:yes stop_codon:yes gene_type:complete
MNAFEIIKLGSNLLKEKKISSFILDSEILLSKALNKTRENVLVNLDQKISKKNILVFKEYLKRRSNYEPIAYILKEKEFWSKKFYINKDTLIPRPETELLVDKTLKIYKEKKISILDIGTGSGCIILSLLSSLKNSNGIGVDISKNAIFTAKKNALKLKLTKRVKFFNKSFKNIFGKKFDLIVSNPPYVERKDIKNLSDDIKRYEPRLALDGGNDGLDLIKKVIYKSKDILKIKGMLALEIGNEQIKIVSKILIDNNFRIKHVIRDYKNNVRCVFAYYN